MPEKKSAAETKAAKPKTGSDKPTAQKKAASGKSAEKKKSAPKTPRKSTPKKKSASNAKKELTAAVEKKTAPKTAPKREFRVCVLGGCAAMAVPALRELAAEDEVKAVTLADLNGVAAQAVAAGMGPKFSGVAVDAMDHDQVVELATAHDVVMGYVGPFYLFEDKIAKACIEARTPYVSIADDFDSYLKVEQLFDEAKAAGVTILTGFGNSPGITNVLSKKGYLSMDEPERISINWTGGSDEEVGPANVKHVMHIFEGETLQWIDGREARVKTGRGEKVVEFPEPIGIQTVFYTGHAESVSIPRNLKGLKEVTLHGGVRPVWVARIATFFGDLGLTTSHKKREIMTKLLTPIMGAFSVGDTADKSVFRIDVTGRHEGEPRHHFYTGVGHIAEITSMPTVEAAMMLLRKEIDKPGVFAPEAIVDPDDFLPRIAKRGVELTYYEGRREKPVK